MPTPRKIRCAVAGITDHGGRVYTVLLKPESHSPAFRPGQFLHLALDEYDPSAFWPESRVFSIASNPAERDHLLICYSVKGAFTTRLESELRVGRHVWVKLPYGDFAIAPDPEVVMFAGGTGISAFTAFLAGLSADWGGRIQLYYGARSPDLLLFRQELEQTLARVGCFHISYCVERGSIASGNQFNGRLTFRQGILSSKFPLQDGFRISTTVFYLSGPPAMLKSLSGSLLALGVAPERVRIDAWE